MSFADSPAPRILVVDDQADVREALRLLFKAEGWSTQTAESPARALPRVQPGAFDLALIDLNYARDTTSGEEGMKFLEDLRVVDAALPVVVMTAWGSVELAVDAMRRGARDFVQKPWDNARVLAIARTQMELSRALRRGSRLEAENQALRGLGDPGTPFIASSPAMQPVLRLIERVGPSNANVLITGANGSGKGLVARALHAASPRSAKALLTVNTGGLAESVFESELFGHVKGAFTDAKTDRVGRFELADGGTLFLDEIANVPLSQQSRLLRVIESGEFERVGSSQTLRADVRILSATNADLRLEVERGRFREDLLFRLNTIEIRLPPLAERQEDIPLLAAYFLRAHARRYRKEDLELDACAVEALRRHPWPGNVRELSHAIERGVLMARDSTVRAADLGLQLAGEGSPPLDQMSLDEVEAYLIRRTLARHGGSAVRAAQALGLSRSAFYRRLQRLGL